MTQCSIIQRMSPLQFDPREDDTHLIPLVAHNPPGDGPKNVTLAPTLRASVTG